MEWTCTVFKAGAAVAAGPVRDVVATLHARREAHGDEGLLVFDDRTGGAVDFDLRGSAADAQAVLPHHPLWPATPPPEKRGRGRPRLGVVSREVSLLPRHWSWIKAQRGSASAVLRRLIEREMKADAPADEVRARAERAHAFLWTMAGDLPGFEAASRALYAGALDTYAALAAAWPDDVRAYADRLLG